MSSTPPYLITGAAGSIGRSLVASLATIDAQVFALDCNEAGLEQLAADFPGVECVLDDLRRPVSLNRVLHQRPIVVHAAAYKDVPFLERQPQAALLNNAVASAELFTACIQASVPYVLLISSDKSVEPLSWLGRSKWLAEQAARLAATKIPLGVARLANVLGSSNSVLARWLSAVEAGQACVGTVADVTRHYMSAVQVSDMLFHMIAARQTGVAVALNAQQHSVAQLFDMFRQSATVQGRETSIRWTGLRPGEKHSESLAWPGEIRIDAASVEPGAPSAEKLPYQRLSWRSAADDDDFAARLRQFLTQVPRLEPHQLELEYQQLEAPWCAEAIPATTEARHHEL